VGIFRLYKIWRTSPSFRRRLISFTSSIPLLCPHPMGGAHRCDPVPFSIETVQVASCFCPVLRRGFFFISGSPPFLPQCPPGQRAALLDCKCSFRPSPCNLPPTRFFSFPETFSVLSPVQPTPPTFFFSSQTSYGYYFLKERFRQSLLCFPFLSELFHLPAGQEILLPVSHDAYPLLVGLSNSWRSGDSSPPLKFFPETQSLSASA